MNAVCVLCLISARVHPPSQTFSVDSINSTYIIDLHLTESWTECMIYFIYEFMCAERTEMKSNLMDSLLIVIIVGGSQ